MPSPRVTMVHKDLPDQPITVSEQSVPVHEAAGWKLAPKTQQPEPLETEKN